MASTIIQPVADKLKTILEGLVLDTPLNVPVDAWTRDHLNTPAAEIEVPDVGRSDLEPDGGSESQLGSDDWDLDYKVTLWYDLREPTVAQKRLVEALEKWVAAVDADRTLGNLVEDARVTDARRVYQLETDRTLVGYETTVQTRLLV